MAHIDIHDFRPGKVYEHTPGRAGAFLIDAALLEAAATYKKETADRRSIEEIAQEMAKPGQFQQLPELGPTLVERRTKLRDAVLSMFTDQPITLTLLRRLEAAIAEHVV